MANTPNNFQIGRMRHRVLLQARGSTGLGDRGQNATGWSTGTEFNAAITQLTGREGELARQRFPTATLKVTTWNSTAIKPIKRFLFGTRKLSILDANTPDELDRVTVCLCGEEKT